MWPKAGGAIFKNFEHENQNVQNGRTLNLKNFGTNDAGWDRISLEKNSVADPQTYEIRNGNQVYAQRCYNLGTTCTSYTEMVISGGRVGGTLPSTIQTKLTEGMNSPNGNDWFIPR